MKFFSLFFSAISAQAISDSEATAIVAHELKHCHQNHGHHDNHEQVCLDHIREKLEHSFGIQVTCGFTADAINVVYEGYWHATESSYGGVLCGESSIKIDSAGLDFTCEHASHKCHGSGRAYNACVADDLVKNAAHRLCSTSRDINVIASDPAFTCLSGTGAETLSCGNAVVSAWCIHR